MGGAITRMTRERACKDHIADLEHQLHLCKVSLHSFLVITKGFGAAFGIICTYILWS